MYFSFVPRAHHNGWDITDANASNRRCWKYINGTDNHLLFTSHVSLICMIHYFIATTCLLFESSSLWRQTPLPHIKPFLSLLCLHVQVTQHGCCMTHTASLWTWPPSSQRRKAWWWTSLPSKRRKRQHRWGDGRRSGGKWRKPSVLNDCLFEFGLDHSVKGHSTEQCFVSTTVGTYLASCQRSPVLHSKSESRAVHLLFKWTLVYFTALC